MNDKEIQTFVALVEQMRNAQREYFRGRMGRDLDRAKKYEREVDRTIREWKAKQMDSLQLKLF
ncbi:MAG: hypothetical protein J6R22_02780 [Alphaproteobacteria bacterium]|nr:hypothetical protein [Alphaproteobacteria bacterium]